MPETLKTCLTFKAEQASMHEQNELACGVLVMNRLGLVDLRSNQLLKWLGLAGYEQQPTAQMAVIMI